ncbi:Ketoisovalerate reductase BEA2 [Cladobotryum mycophilum]|uniref:Ketoisovalerate reductase BEA2 n=1 Tax=Cladobotryum mycophilum TaxID=491253 RepID=A0ABR0T0J1_9HYPO
MATISAAPSRFTSKTLRLGPCKCVGNLGRLYASSLKQHPDNPPVTLVVHRKELLSQWLDSNGIEITRFGALKVNRDFDVEWWTETPPEQGRVCEVAGGKALHNLIIGTKASSAMPEVDRLRRYLSRNSTAAFLQNGMSKLWPPHGPEYISQRYTAGEEPNFLACINNHGVFSEGPFRSVHASPADVAMGSVLLNAKNSAPASSIGYLTKMITTAPYLNARSVSRADLWVLQLQKLVVNSVINPLTAILGCKNGWLFEDEDGPVAQVIDKLLAEASGVLQALINHDSSADILAPPPESVNSNQGVGQDYLKPLRAQLTAQFSQPQLRQMLYRIGEIVKENNSSMLQDVRAGKPTEIHDFNGWLVDTASFLNLTAHSSDGVNLNANIRAGDTPTHRILIDLVEARVVMNLSDLAQCLLAA